MNKSNEQPLNPLRCIATDGWQKMGLASYEGMVHRVCSEPASNPCRKHDGSSRERVSKWSTEDLAVTCMHAILCHSKDKLPSISISQWTNFVFPLPLYKSPLLSIGLFFSIGEVYCSDVYDSKGILYTLSHWCLFAFDFLTSVSISAAWVYTHTQFVLFLNFC